MGSAKCSSATTAICVLTATSSSLCLSKRLILLTAETVSHTALCPHATHGRRHTKTTEHTNETGQPSPRPQLVSRPPAAPQSLCIGTLWQHSWDSRRPHYSAQSCPAATGEAVCTADGKARDDETSPANPTPLALPQVCSGWPETPQQGLAHKPAGHSCLCSLTFVLGQRLNGVTPEAVRQEYSGHTPLPGAP